MEDIQQLREIAKAQKLLIYAVLLGVVATFLFPLMLISIPLMMFAVIKFSLSLGYSPAAAILLMMLMFIPLVSLVILLILNDKATKRLKAAGVDVGLMGADVSKIG